MENSKYMNCVSMTSYVKEGSIVYFSALNSNALYKYDIEKEKLFFLRAFPNESISEKHLHCDTIMLDSRVYFLPLNGRNIHIYDLVSGEIEYIDLISYVEASVASKFNKAILWGKKIILIPGRSHYILIFNTETNEIYANNSWYKENSFQVESDSIMVKYAAFIREQSLYLFSMVSNYVSKVSLTDYSTEIIHVGSAPQGYSDACFDDITNQVWLLQNGTNKVTVWNIETADSTEIEFVPENKVADITYPYMRLLDVGKYIYLFAYQADCTVLLNKETYESHFVKWMDQEISESHPEWSAKHYMAWKIDEEKVMVANAGTYSFQIISKDNEEKRFYLYDELKTKRNSFVKDLLHNETTGLSLKDFLKLMESV